MLGFLEIEGLRPQHTAPPPCLWGPELGLAVDSAGSDQELLGAQRQGEERAQDFGETESPAAIINTMQFKNTYFGPTAYQALC